MSFLIPPKHNSDGHAEQPESVSDFMEQRDVFADARRDIVTYLVHNALEPDSAVDVRKCVNQRHFLKWTDIDRLLREVQPLAQKEIARQLAERGRLESQRAAFQELADLFSALGLKIETNSDKYTLIGLTREQAQLCGDFLQSTSGDDI